MEIDIICGLYHYGLTMIKLDDGYCMVDMKTNEMYGKMSIYYIRSLVNQWNRHRLHRKEKDDGKINRE